MIFLKRRALMTRASFNYKTVNGIGSAVLENCVETKFKRLVLSGNSTQTTTKGINLIPFKVGEKIESSNKGNSVVFGKDGVNITIYNRNPIKESDLYFFGNDNNADETGYTDVLPAGEYTFLSNSKLCNFFVVAWRNGTSKVIVERSDKLITHFTVLDGDKVRLFLRPKGNVNLKGTEKAQVMLCKHAETNLPYEPYTDGKPSPSVEYPQEIVSAGNDGKIEVSVNGKNLFDLSQYDKYDDTWTNTSYTNKKLKLRPNTTYTMTFKRLVDRPEHYVVFGILNGIKDGSLPFIQINHDLSLNIFTAKGTFTTDEAGEITFKYYVDVPKDQYWFTEVIGDIQIELGTEQTEYEPYRESQTITLQLDRPLTKWDRLEKRDSIWGIARQSNKKILDGTEEWEIYGNKVHTFSCSSSTIIIDGFCTHYKNIGSDEIGTKTGVYLQYTSSIIITDLKIDNAEEFKAWLAQQKETGTPVELVYKTKTETWEPLPEETQLVLESLYAFDGTTVINVDSGEVETGIEVEYAVKE